MRSEWDPDPVRLWPCKQRERCQGRVLTEKSAEDTVRTQLFAHQVERPYEEPTMPTF